MKNKYFKFLIIILAVAVIVPQIALAAWWNPFSWGIWNRVFHFQRNQNSNVACTMDAKQCPDGSYVGRTPPKCEFKPCPESKTKDQTAGWKTYDRGDGFEFKYPKEWVADTVISGTVTNINVWGSEQKLQESKKAIVPIYPEFSVSYRQMDSFKSFAKELLGKEINSVKDFVSSNFSRFATTKIAGKTAYAGITVANRTVYSVYIEDNNRVYVLSTGNLDENFQNPNNPKLDKNIQMIISTFRLFSTPIVGGDKDSHGCIGSAGYSWCEAKQKCLRVWEEKCQ